MGKITASYILGILAFMMSMAGPFSLILSLIGLFLGISALKMPKQDIVIPFGYKGVVGEKNMTAQPFVSNRYVMYIAIGINILALLASLVSSIIFFSVIGTK